MKIRKMYAFTLGLLIVALLLPSPASATAPSSEMKLFRNPVVGDGADPWVVKHTDGYYYYMQTTGNNLTIRRSKTLTGLDDAEKKVIWTPEPGSENSGNIWAPELHYLDGKWYIYFAAGDGDMGKQRMYVLESEGSDPFGKYSYPKGTHLGKISDPSDKWAIDGTVLEYKNKRYFVWSGWEGDENVSQQIYIAPMKNPWTISGDRVELSRPALPWEKNGTPLINEGPQILKNKQGDVFIVYSASGSWTDDYCLGMLKLTAKDPLKAENWSKNPEPVFKSSPADNVYGPGHNSFVKSPDGKEDWIVYHAAKFKGAGWNRNVRMQKFSWNADGTPNFGTPVPADTLLRAPSGEGGGKLVPALPGIIYSYEAESGVVNHATIVNNTGTSGGSKVGMIDYNDSYVEFNVDAPPGDYTLKVRYSNGMGETSTHQLALNGELLGEVKYPSYGWDTWRDAERDIHLNAGKNKIRLSKATLFAEIDRIDLVPKKTKVFQYEAELGYLKNAKGVNEYDAANHQKVGLMSAHNSSVRFPISVEKSGTYEINIRYKQPEGNHAVQVIHDNGKKSLVLYKGEGSDQWKNTAVKVKLKKGKNEISFSKGRGAVELDYFRLNQTK
ncbi:Beta-xylosidase, GH43 family [Fictibacillus solisalsi]|uniref:Beta-xylosidase, GH43 family n=1 Tax=Fictibacillus solisalsi TaxID=459525 RepID=A0A1G9YJ00_9BACL|nr:family 43 glycosylhydrolase [Fictibacillus solisalsi]SDN09189.1 Beta-xylosidase, GH43 family [Fictibacillus solisalsi]